ncbi:MAG: hypothetical protein ACO3U3_13445 [Alphaproteobacteria bacterium]
MILANSPLFPKSHGLKGRVIISLTSYPERFQSLYLTLLCLCHQTVKPDLIFVSISSEDENLFFSHMGLRRLVDESAIEVHLTSNWRSYKKFVPALLRFQDAFLVAADDDMYYWPTWLEELTSEVLVDSNRVVAHRVHRVIFDDRGNPLPYLKWLRVISDTKPMASNFPTTGGGVIFPPSTFQEGVSDIELALELCPHSDDVWVYFWLLKSGKIARATGTPNKEVMWPLPQPSSLWSINSIGENDAAIGRMKLRFGPVWQRQSTIEVRSNFSEKAYWQARYKNGRTSGSGSQGKLAFYKAEIINGLAEKYGVKVAVELGCGDGRQLSLYQFNDYIGTDIAEESIEMCKARILNATRFRFLNMVDFKTTRPRGDLSLSVDVIFHLVNDSVYFDYMEMLFESSTRLVLIYGPNQEISSNESHIRFRCFTSWIESHRPNFRLVEFIKNKYPYHPGADPEKSSWSDFYLFEKLGS